MAATPSLMTDKDRSKGGFSKLFGFLSRTDENISLELQQQLEDARAELSTRINILEQAAIVSEGDLKGNITYCNEKFCQVSGYTQEELLGQPHSILRHPDMPSEAFRDMWRTIGSGNVWQGEVKNRKKDGSPYWVIATIAPVMGANGKPAKYISVRFDITDQKLLEEKLQHQIEDLRAQDEELRQLTEELSSTEEELRQNLEEINAMNDQLVVAQVELTAQVAALNNAAIVSETDLRGNIIYVNDTFCRISGYTRDELMGQNHRILKSGHQPDEIFRDMWATIAKGDVWRGVIKNRKKDGTYYWVGTTVTPVRDNTGKLQKFIAVRFDITAQVEHENRADDMRAQLEAANADLAAAKAVVEEKLGQKNTELHESVVYAQRLQRAIIPKPEDMAQIMPQGFQASVYYQPKDAVGGDFYWAGRHRNKTVLAVGDGTGHGVPGAFMSILGITALRKMVEDRGLTEPVSILEEMDNEIRTVLNQQSEGVEIQDSLELNILTFTDGKGVIQMGSAMRPALLVRRGVATELAHDKKPVGGTQFLGDSDFTAHNVQMEPGDMLYLFSDGFMTQLGGPGNATRKFGKQQFYDLLTQLSAFDRLNDQMKGLYKVFGEWKGFFRDQTDDIIVLALRYVG